MNILHVNIKKLHVDIKILQLEILIYVNINQLDIDKERRMSTKQKPCMLTIKCRQYLIFFFGRIVI